MTLDRFALCPGGTGRKIKFCSSECATQLERLQKLIDARQNRAALQQVVNWLERTPDRACLWAQRCLLERAEGDLEGHEASAQEFARRFPDSPIALAELAITHALHDRFAEAVRAAGDSLENCQRQQRLYYRSVWACITVAEALNEAGHLPAALAILSLLNGRVSGNLAEELTQTFREMVRVPVVPLDLRAAPWHGLDPETEQRQLLERIVGPLQLFRFGQAEAEVLRYLEAHPHDPGAWYCLGSLRLWQTNYPGAAEAYQRCGEVDTAGPLGMLGLLRSILLRKNGLGDVEDTYCLVWDVPEPDRAKELLLSDRRLMPARRHFPPHLWPPGYEEVPPELDFILLRHPRPLDDPREFFAHLDSYRPPVLGEVLFFGRQTDRPAQIVVLAVAESDRAEVQKIVEQWLRQEGLPPTREHTLHSTSLVIRCLTDLPELATQFGVPWTEVQSRLVEGMSQWRLPILQPLSLGEAAQSPEKRQWVRGIIAAVQARAASFRILRSLVTFWEKWGLDFGPGIDGNRLVRAYPHPQVGLYLDPATLSDEHLELLCHSYYFTYEVEFLIRIAPIILAHRERFAPTTVKVAYLTRLLEFLHTAPEEWPSHRPLLEEAISYCEQHGLPHGEFHEIELMASVMRESAPAPSEELAGTVHAILLHIHDHHLNEPGMAELLAKFLAAVAGQPQSPRQTPSSGVQPEKPRTTLWTPDSLSPGPQSPSEPAKKIWVPGMD